MNLTEGYQGKRITVATTMANGTVEQKEIFVGNNKGILVIKTGEECTESEAYNIHRSICDSFNDLPNGETLICTVPHYVSIEYIKL